MSETLKFKCPSCGAPFKAIVNSSDEYKPVCTGCRKVFTRDEIIRQVRDLAVKGLKKTFTRIKR
ncbi:MAG: hypothetical protein WDM89_17270 [Rhizomicrobium sp.]